MREADVMPRKSQHRTPAQASRRFGFSFVEVLFAVILLGLGFVMLAAVFPVAIRQTQTTIEETAGSWLAQGAVKAVQQIASDELLPPTGPDGVPGKVCYFRDNGVIGDAAANQLWSAVRGNLILSQDPRYAWLPMYRRNRGDSFAQLIIIAVQCRNRPAYDPAVDIFRWNGGAVLDVLSHSQRATLEPRELPAILSAAAGGAADTVRFTGGDLDAVGEGAYIVIKDDQSPATPGRANGFVFRLGTLVARDASGVTWQLMAGHDAKGASYPASGTAMPAQVLVMGRGRSDPKNGGAYEGPVQDVAAYTTFIRLN